MNKTILTILLLALALGLSAQAGLFYIRYDMSMAEAIEHMKDEGFTVSEYADNSIEMVSPDNAYVEYIDINFADDNNSIMNWSVVYLPQDDEEIEDLVFDALVSHHGDGYEYDEDLETYYWNLDDVHWVYAGWDWSYETFWVDYTTE